MFWADHFLNLEMFGFFLYVCVLQLKLNCKAANLLALLTPFRAAGAQDVEFVTIPGKNTVYFSKVFYSATQRHTVGVQAGMCNDLHTTLLFQPVDKAKGNNHPLADHRTWWSVTEMPVHQFHTSCVETAACQEQRCKITHHALHVSLKMLQEACISFRWKQI